MKTKLLLVTLLLVIVGSCRKPATTNATSVTSNEVLTDFVNYLVLPQYASLQERAVTLNNAIKTLNDTPTNAHLDAARTAWRNVRAAWEQCEGFLIGPVEDDNYDPNMDTWPVDHLQLDSFVAVTPSFASAAIQAQSSSLRGFHPIEFMLWGKHGQATIDSISPRQHQYLAGLAEDLLQSANALSNSWLASSGNFQAQLLEAGKGSVRYHSRRDALLAMVAGMSEICDEVANGKIEGPYAAYDSTRTESPFSHNSLTDFNYNITGARSVYICNFNGQMGKSLSDMVAARNLALDNKLKQQFGAAIIALNIVSVTFESAIYTQRPQLQSAMAAIRNLQETLDGDLKTFVQTNITD